MQSGGRAAADAAGGNAGRTGAGKNRPAGDAAGLYGGGKGLHRRPWPRQKTGGDSERPVIGRHRYRRVSGLRRRPEKSSGKGSGAVLSEGCAPHAHGTAGLGPGKGPGTDPRPEGRRVGTDPGAGGGRRPLSAPRRDRQRQDGGIHPSGASSAGNGQNRHRAGAGNCPDPSDGALVSCPVWGRGGGTALRPFRGRTLR